LAEYPENKLALMKTVKLAETVIQAVRDEPPTSSAREAAMYTVARSFFFKISLLLLRSPSLLGIELTCYKKTAV